LYVLARRNQAQKIPSTRDSRHAPVWSRVWAATIVGEPPLAADEDRSHHEKSGNLDKNNLNFK
jgi:hypothetical protein